MADWWKDDIVKLLAKMNNRKEAEFFKEPVEWKAMGLTDYPIIIKKPMDLRTVRQNLDEGLYQTPLEAAADIRLIFLNAMTYNAPGSRVYVHAKNMSEYWENNSSSLLKGYEDPDRPATVEEMTHWVDKCHRISANDLGKVLNLLNEMCPNSLIKRADTNEVEVNVDLITGQAFRKALALVNSILPDITLTSSRRSAKAAAATAAAIAAATSTTVAADAAAEGVSSLITIE